MDKFTLITNIGVNPVGGKEHLREVYIQYIDNFDPISQSGQQMDTYAVCHKNTISINFSFGWFEITFNGKKYMGYSDGNMYFDGSQIIPFPCYNIGYSLSNNL